ncbi:MAG: c-type cytochrome [Planctomycetia bacterium]|nr:c-type cytochrome [Planctomycetia bacterium]
MTELARQHALRFVATAMLLLACVGCGRPTPADRPQLPDQVVDFNLLYGRNCSGCHGADGAHGPAPPLNDRLLLAILPPEELSKLITEGRSGSLMPPFEHGHGGPLTPRQVAIIADGIRQRWGSPSDVPQEMLPKYHGPRDNSAADAEAGSRLFEHHCSKCHGAEGKGGKRGPLNDPALLTMLSDQTLRRLVITGRPDLGMPSYLKLVETERGDLHGANREIDDLVAYMVSWRKPLALSLPAEPTTTGIKR